MKNKGIYLHFADFCIRSLLFSCHILIFFYHRLHVYGIFIDIVSSACAQFNLVQVKNMTAMGNHCLTNYKLAWIQLNFLAWVMQI